MRFRITVAEADVHLRGYVDGRETLLALADTMKPIGIVVASPAEDDYDPFKPPGYDGSISKPPHIYGEETL